MFKQQSGLGTMKPYNPKNKYVGLRSARIENVDDWEEKGKITVIFLDGIKRGGIFDVWIVENNTHVEPEKDDIVIIGFLDNHKLNGVIVGYLMKKFKRANRVKINKDGVLIRWKVVSGEAYDARKDGTEDEQEGIEVFIHLKSDGDIEIKSEDTDQVGNLIVDLKNINIKCKNIDIECENINIDCDNIDIDSDDIDIDCADITIDAQSLLANIVGALNLSPATANINCGTSFILSCESGSITASEGFSITRNTAEDPQSTVWE